MDWVLTAMLDDWYLEGERLNACKKAVAALVFFRPHFGRGAGCLLAGARQALRGWKRLDPPASRLPLPWAVVEMIANALLFAQEYEAALVCLLCFFTCFRPSEPFKLLGKHVIAPCPRAGAGHQYWALTLHPFELHAPSKTQEYDESILLDEEYALFLGPLLAQLGARNGVDNSLFTINQLQFGHCFRAACERLHLKCLGSPTPYQLRHSGASWEFAAGTRTLAEVQRPGRWRATASVRRYEKGGRVTEQLAKLLPPSRFHAIACADTIVSAVCGLRLPLAPT